MKFLCFGYLDVKNWETKSEDERNAMIDACFAYDDVLKKNGNWAGGEGIQGPDSRENFALPERQTLRDGWALRGNERTPGRSSDYRGQGSESCRSADFKPSRRENGTVGNSPGSRHHADDSRKRKASCLRRWFMMRIIRMLRLTAQGGKFSISEQHRASRSNRAGCAD